jgi:hypothetical protein
LLLTVLTPLAIPGGFVGALFVIGFGKGLCGFCIGFAFTSSFGLGFD